MEGQGGFDWSEIERAYEHVARLEREGGAESERNAAYERLKAHLRPIALSMACELAPNPRQAEEAVDKLLTYLPMLVPQYAAPATPCSQWVARTLVAYVYNTVYGEDAPLSSNPLSVAAPSPASQSMHELIEWLLQVLTADEFAVWYDCIISGCSIAEAATLAGDTPEAVLAALERARRKVRDAFATEAGRQALTAALGMDLKWLGAPRRSDHSSVAYSVANNGAVAGVAFIEERRPREEGGEERVYIAVACRWHNDCWEELGALGAVSEPHCMITPAGDCIVASGGGTTIRWSEVGGVESVEIEGVVYGVSAGAEVMVGEQSGHAARWRDGAAERLSQENPSAARAVSAEGAIVVGHAHHKACIWDANGAQRLLGTLYGGRSEAQAVAAEGQVVVGMSDDRAFRWSLHDGMCALRQGEDDYSCAYGVSHDGARVVGKMLGDQGTHAFLWMPDVGVEDLNELFAPWLSRMSFLECAHGISPNGRYIVGEGYCADRERKEAFLLDLGEAVPS
ncbi:MAG: hypothetical protein N2651_06170 [Fimbriimonadales bacterium]|nr:hypothetical protein [Fimbriimonadales bacterium]